ncbi:sulfatase [Arcobacter nitrofigilis DSM 7299]|uniref:Sulfatase n=1 Tax=Arcobacter nitrofigilis (strain ATCC 33309 / DSM 7299 / CCUG 15893 / LMG 7604 / NCTC 12251 / CI) TaxID=572480 RepID=D5V809_ARCNC|nr:phosphoethanolamine--lipid A transferase [Arcobacter nitrofigilis]ADG94779.1 sulfatase [Arcobacter nitrofigilis DSM 7299]
MKNITQYKLILFVAIFLTTFCNLSFFKSILTIYPFAGTDIIYIISITFVLISLIVFLFSLVATKYTTKPILIIVLIVSSFTAYFMDTYHVVIDTEMIRNTLQTNLSESSDLFSMQLVFYVLLLGLIPSFIIYKLKINYRPLKSEIFAKLKTLIISLLVIVIIILSLSKFYTSFFREHKPLRYNANPVFWVYSIGNYIHKTLTSGPLVLEVIGKDAKFSPEEYRSPKKELLIMVVGEAARANRFSLNGYKRETNPLLKKEDIINFPNMYSCGTSTAVSVPCMFSVYPRSDYTYKKGISTENVIDILNNTKKVNILWRDNNSDSKGVALRVDYQDYRTPKNNTMCQNGECRDEGMLVGLDKFIEKHKKEDILIVLHQMGNHGPAYYKRYPKEFEKFKPVCKTNQLEQCTKEEVGNAYDNAILYTDYFLSKTINFLKQYSNDYHTGLIYMSDHGESLGENGLYLHGMPYLIAPDEQRHIGALMWFGDDDINTQRVKAYSNKRFSQDNLFHTLLGFFEVETNVYKKNMDILVNARK